MAEPLTPVIRKLLAECAEQLELMDSYLGFGSTEQRHHAAACRELAQRARLELDAAALRNQLISR
jgi:hypothetical protein